MNQRHHQYHHHDHQMRPRWIITQVNFAHYSLLTSAISIHPIPTRMIFTIHPSIPPTRMIRKTTPVTEILLLTSLGAFANCAGRQNITHLMIDHYIIILIIMMMIIEKKSNFISPQCCNTCSQSSCDCSNCKQKV